VGWLRNHFPANAPPPRDPGGSDAELVAQARQGDARAFALLYRRYLDQVYDFAAHRLASREAAEDATQTTFLRALNSLQGCRDGTLFAGWLFAIARNVINDSYRTGRVSLLPIEEAPELEDPATTPELSAIRAEWSRELGRLREECLKGHDRDLLDLRLQGLTDREIAVALGRSHGAVRTAQYRMVQRLRDCLGIAIRAREAEHADV
jgi:RNA polymerase sigma-70 factor (ECF subfamily)